MRKLQAGGKVTNLHVVQDMTQDGCEHMFQKSFGNKCNRSTHYLNKWLSSYQLSMKKVQGKEKEKKKRQDKRKNKGKDEEGGIGESRQAAPYSQSHSRWISTQVKYDNKIVGGRHGEQSGDDQV